MKLAITWTSSKRKFAPLVYQGDLEKCLYDVSQMGYKGIELAIRTPLDISKREVSRLNSRYNLSVSAITTGLIRSEDGLEFSSLDYMVREKAVSRVKEIINFSLEFNAPVIIGLVRGNLQEEIMDRQRQHITDCFLACAEYAEKQQAKMIIEPINRYETNFLNTISETVSFIDELQTTSIGTMIDVFHMNIEEDSFKNISHAGNYLWYVHVADNNRLAPGLGRLDFNEIIGYLHELKYNGYYSLECIPSSSPYDTALQNINYLRSITGTTSKKKEILYESSCVD